MIERVETVAYGRPSSEALAQAVRRAKGDDPLAPVTVIVPSNFTGLTARRLLGGGLGGLPGLAGVAFVTPLRLGELLAADELLGSRPLTNPVLGAAVRRALADDPGPFAAVADHHATEAALATLYAELSNVSPATRARLLRDGGPSARTAVRMHDAIASHLDGFHDEAVVARAASARGRRPEVVATLGRVVWHLPAPTTRPMAELVGAVLDGAPSEVVVGVTGDVAADAAVWSTCRAAGVPEPPPPRQSPPPAMAAHIVSVTDADEEVRAVVRAIVALAADGIRLDRIGVFHPTPDPYAAILQQQLAAAGLPHNGPARRRLADTVAGRTLLAALRLPHERWRRDRVMAVVSGAPVRVGADRVRPARWETITREAGIVQDMADWRRKLAGHRTALAERLVAAEASDDPIAAEVVERRRRAVADVDQLAEFVEALHASVLAVERARGWPARAEAAGSLLEQLLGGGHLHDRWPEGEQLAYERVEDVLARLAALDDLEPEPSHDTFVRALTAELDATRGRVGRFGDGVLFGPLAAAAGHDLDAVFVLGCAEGLWPTARRDDTLLPDAVRELAPGELALRASRLDDQHRAVLAALAAAPPERRTVTFARGDLRGNRRALPSRWLLDAASAAEGRIVHATDFADLGAPTVEVVPSFATAIHGPVAASLAERDLAALATFVEQGGDARLHPLARLVDRGFDVQAARRSSAFTEWDGNLAGQPIPSATDRSLSPTRLERWATCGFRYFLGSVLDLADRDDPERVIELSPLDRGSGVHTALERFLEEAIEAGVPEPHEPWSRAQHERLHEILDEVFAELEARGRTGRALLWQLHAAELHAMLDEFLAVDDAFRAGRGARPERVELPFGLDDAPPVVLTLPDGRSLAFRGRADRVDRAADGHLLVSDYKTGRGLGYVGLHEGDPVREGRLLQLGLYAEAARQLLGATSTEAHYWMVDPRADYERRGYAWTDERRARFVDVLAAIVEGIEGGVFPLVPGEWDSWRGTHASCAYCDFDRLCVRDRGEQAEAKLGAPELRVRDRLRWVDAEDEST